MAKFFTYEKTDNGGLILEKGYSPSRNRVRTTDSYSPSSNGNQSAPIPKLSSAVQRPAHRSANGSSKKK